VFVGRQLAVAAGDAVDAVTRPNRVLLVAHRDRHPPERRSRRVDPRANACDRAASALGDKRVDDGVDPVGLVGEELLGELVGGHGLQWLVECVDLSSQTPIAADDEVGAVRERGSGDVSVLAVHGRHRGLSDVAFVVRVKRRRCGDLGDTASQRGPGRGRCMHRQGFVRSRR
jgi:hypothetical protein